MEGRWCWDLLVYMRLLAWLRSQKAPGSRRAHLQLQGTNAVLIVSWQPKTLLLCTSSWLVCCSRRASSAEDGLGAYQCRHPELKQ